MIDPPPTEDVLRPIRADMVKTLDQVEADLAAGKLALMTPAELAVIVLKATGWARTALDIATSLGRERDAYHAQLVEQMRKRTREGLERLPAGGRA